MKMLLMMRSRMAVKSGCMGRKGWRLNFGHGDAGKERRGEMQRGGAKKN
jgi:hypothetical protein